MITITQRLAQTLDRIKLAAQKYQRDPATVQLLAVSKTKPISDIILAYKAGQKTFGENYVQEGVEKVQALSSQYPDIEWHFIGSLQSNKTKEVAQHFDWMHTLSREKIANRLNEQRPEDKTPLNVCIQVNTSGEETKSGLLLEQVDALADFIQQCSNLKLRGLMAIPSRKDNTEKLNKELILLSEKFKQLQHKYQNIDTLSVGMSQDLELAVENGSTMVRIGSAIFGERVQTN
ncbi:YggS family pyridoxal phosphate-dependent enzyme [Parashewanella curva]|uniref:Pyridoxal phosphate homeostasis protein n=1 Tax=Parashewanella curva TaxID=2338552 RepID=A0A3L8PTX0_9GAMM|nr:YggS family pyridoxal phosphate-dependent enzyme [Parashewanella curva]RLV58259.1 YggS family pyridoxal phosphate-dependent enzyme [Parashewanella curva]